MKWLRIAENTVPKIVNPQDLEISYSLDFQDYFVPVPWDTKLYVTDIGEMKLGFSHRYILAKILKKLEVQYPEGMPADMIRTAPVPQTSEGLVRRKSCECTEAEKRKKQDFKKRRWLNISDYAPALWEFTTGDELSTERINRPEETFEVSHGY